MGACIPLVAPSVAEGLGITFATPARRRLESRGALLRFLTNEADNVQTNGNLTKLGVEPDILRVPLVRFNQWAAASKFKL